MCTCGRMGLIMTKLRSNLLTITLDALMMLYINGPSMEQVVELVAADKDPAMTFSPTVNLLELCKRALKKRCAAASQGLDFDCLGPSGLGSEAQNRA